MQPDFAVIPAAILDAPVVDSYPSESSTRRAWPTWPPRSQLRVDPEALTASLNLCRAILRSKVLAGEAAEEFWRAAALAMNIPNAPCCCSCAAESCGTPGTPTWSSTAC